MRKKEGLQELWGNVQKSPTIIPRPGELQKQVVEWIQCIFQSCYLDMNIDFATNCLSFD